MEERDRIDLKDSLFTLTNWIIDRLEENKYENYEVFELGSAMQRLNAHLDSLKME